MKKINWIFGLNEIMKIIVIDVDEILMYKMIIFELILLINKKVCYI